MQRRMYKKIQAIIITINLASQTKSVKIVALVTTELPNLVADVNASNAADVDVSNATDVAEVVHKVVIIKVILYLAANRRTVTTDKPYIAADHQPPTEKKMRTQKMIQWQTQKRMKKMYKKIPLMAMVLVKNFNE